MTNITIEDIEILTGDAMSVELLFALCEAAYHKCNGDEERFDEELLKLIKPSILIG